MAINIASHKKVSIVFNHVGRKIKQPTIEIVNSKHVIAVQTKKD